MKKTLLLLTAMLFSVASVFAQVTWGLTNGTLTISGTGAMPSNWWGYGVPWYSNQSSITTIVIESGVVSICNAAFWGCSNLTTFTITNGPNPLNLGASDPIFGSCPLFTTVNLGRNISGTPFQNRTSITKVNITGNNVNKIEDSAFSGCSSLSSINLPNTITSIGSSAFNDCTSLISINLPNSINKIAQGAFSYSGLLSIEIPTNINNIGQNAFSGCKNLTTFSIVNGTNPLSFGDYVFLGCSQLQTVNLGRNISGTPFQNIKTITKVNITGNSVDRIENSAFYGCTGITIITSENPTPPISGNNCFYDVNKTTSMVNVPYDSRCLYKAANGWKDFENIIDGTTYLCEQSIDDIPENQLQIYPNPTTGKLSVVSVQLSVESIEIFDVYGRNVASHHFIISSSNHLINISHLSAGVYFVKIRTEAGEVVRKVVKE